MAQPKIKTAVIIGIAAIFAGGVTAVTLKEGAEPGQSGSSVTNVTQDAGLKQPRPWQSEKAGFPEFYKNPPEVTILPTIFPKQGHLSSDGKKGVIGIGYPLTRIAQVAYNKTGLRTVVTGQIKDERYDLFVKLAPDDPRNWRIVLQEKLKSELGVTGKVELRESDVLILRQVNKEASGFKPANNFRKETNTNARRAFKQAAGEFAGFNQPVSTLKGFLERRLEIPIIDQTGITNNFDYAVTWKGDTTLRHDNEGLKQALLEQLGLQLVPSREKIEMLILE